MKYAYAIVTKKEKHITITNKDVIELINNFYKARNRETRDYFIALIAKKTGKKIQRVGKYFKSAL